MIADLKPYGTYKDSGLLWLQQVPEHWGRRRMKFLFKERAQKGFPEEPLLAATQTKGVVRKADYGKRTVTAMKDFHLLKLVEVGDFVISLRSFEGGIEVSHCRGIISPAYTVLSPTHDASQSYYSRLFKSADFIRSLTLFVTGIREGQNIDYERMSRAYMPLPPLDEQLAIGWFLDWANGRLERTIRAKRRVIALLTEQKQAIIHRAVTRGLDPTVPLKPSGIPWLGDIPQHWVVVTVGTVMTLIQTGPFGSQLHSHEYVTAGIPIINPSHMQNGKIVPSLEVTVSNEKSIELERHKLCPGDVIAARRGELGRCALVTTAENGWLCGTGSLLLRCKPVMVLPAYFAKVFSSRGITDMLNLSSIGATMPNLNAGMVARQRIPIPPLELQEQIVRFIDAENQQTEVAINKIKREIELLREYRTRLVADVVTGKLDVREAAARLPRDADEPASEPDGLAEDGDSDSDELTELEA